MHLNDTRAQFGLILHAADIVGQEEHLRVSNARDYVEFRIIVIDKLETVVGDLLLLALGQAPFLEVFLPGSTERRI